MTFREEGNIIWKKVVFWHHLNVLKTFDCPCHFRLPKFNRLCNMLKISAGDTWVVHPLGPKWQLCCSVGACGSSEPVQSELQPAHTQQVSSSSIDIKTAPPPAQALSACPGLGSLPCPALIMVGTTLMNPSFPDSWLILNSSLFLNDLSRT